MSVVYGLLSRAEPDRVRYVGWTEKPAVRLEQHRSERGRRTKRDKWIWSMRDRGLVIDMIILQDPGTLEDEVRWITELQPDLNGTAGGAGGQTVKPGTKLGHGERIKAGQLKRKAEGWIYPKVELTAAARLSRSARMRRLSLKERQQNFETAQRAFNSLPRSCCASCRREMKTYQLTTHIGSRRCVQDGTSMVQ